MVHIFRHRLRSKHTWWYIISIVLKAIFELVLSCSQKAAHQSSPTSKLPTRQRFMSVYVCVYIQLLCMCVSFPAGFDSLAVMDGVFRCEKVNRSPTGVSLSSLSLQIGVCVFVSLHLWTSVCVWIYSKCASWCACVCVCFSQHIFPQLYRLLRYCMYTFVWFFTACFLRLCWKHIGQLDFSLQSGLWPLKK